MRLILRRKDINLLFLLAILCFMCLSACISKEINNLDCEYKTIENKKGNGLDMIIYYPCNWVIDNVDQEGRVTTLKSRLGRIIFTLFSFPLAVDETIDKQSVTDEYLEAYDKLLSVKEVKLNGKEFFELINESSYPEGKITAYTKVLTYVSMFKNRIITFNFSTQALEQDDANEMFKRNEQEFRNMAAKIIFKS